MSDLDTADPVVYIDIMDKKRKLNFSMFAMRKLKRLTGRVFVKGEIDLNDPEDMISFLWAGLVEHSPDLNEFFLPGKPSIKIEKVLDELSKEVDMNREEEITELILQALKNAGYGKKDEGVENMEVEPKKE